MTYGFLEIGIWKGDKSISIEFYFCDGLYHISSKEF